MHVENSLDVRDQQRALLKLERLKMRPMAKVLLDSTTSRTAKLVAISAVAAFVLSLQPITDSFSVRVGAGQECAAASARAIDAAAQSCARLGLLVEKGADISSVRAELSSLFQMVDMEHSRLENIARSAQALLYSAGSALKAAGGGDKTPPNSTWLMQEFMS